MSRGPYNCRGVRTWFNLVYPERSQETQCKLLILSPALALLVLKNHGLNTFRSIAAFFKSIMVVANVFAKHIFEII